MCKHKLCRIFQAKALSGFEVGTKKTRKGVKFAFSRPEYILSGDVAQLVKAPSQ